MLLQIINVLIGLAALLFGLWMLLAFLVQAKESLLFAIEAEWSEAWVELRAGLGMLGWAAVCLVFGAWALLRQAQLLG